MHLILLVLCSFPFNGIHACAELNKIFRLKPMHVFLLGISEMLKECLVEMLGDSQRTSSVMKNFQVQNRTYHQIERKVMSRLQKLWEIQNNYLLVLVYGWIYQNGTVYRFDGTILRPWPYWNAWSFQLSVHRSGLFFLRALKDRTFGNELNLEITQLFTSYVALL